MNTERHMNLWTKYPSTVPHLADDVVTLRAYTARDVPFVQEAVLDPAIPHVDMVVPGPSFEAVARYVGELTTRPLLKQGWAFVITAPDGEVVGHVGVWLGNITLGRVTIGYWVLERHRRKGYAGHALKLVTDWLATLPGVMRIELHIEPWNEGSWRAAQRAGYTREALLKRWQIRDGKPRDMFMYVFLPDIET